MTKPLHFDGRPVAPWLVPRLKWARLHGWRGTVISGWRSDADQIAAGTNYARRLGKPVSAVYPNGLLASNHCGLKWPKGAVDVTDPEGLAQAMRKWENEGHRRPMRWGWPTIGDRPHFSANGH